MELDINALQMLQEAQPEVGLRPCKETCIKWESCVGVTIIGV